MPAEKVNGSQENGSNNEFMMVKKKGRDRFDMKGDPAWLDMVEEAARAVHGLTMAGYVKMSVNAQLRKDGFLPLIPSDADNIPQAATQPRRKSKKKQE